jgi:hypothetical protein
MTPVLNYPLKALETIVVDIGCDFICIPLPWNPGGDNFSDLFRNYGLFYIEL